MPMLLAYWELGRMLAQRIFGIDLQRSELVRCGLVDGERREG